MTRTAAASSVAIWLLVACTFLTPEPGGQLIGRGELDGASWSVTAAREGDGVCRKTDVAGEVSESCDYPFTEPIEPLGSFSVPGTSFPASDLPIVVHGVARADVARVVLETTTGTAEAPVVSMRSLGLSAGGFAAALPAGARLLSIIAFAEDGSELQRLPW